MTTTLLFFARFLNWTLGFTEKDLIAAIIAAIVLAILLYFWKKIASFLSGLVYPVRINGTWNTQIKRTTDNPHEGAHQTGRPGTLADHETAKLYQFGPRVWGSTETNDFEKRKYRIRGRITSDKLSMIYSEVTRPRLDAGALLLVIAQGGDVMEGYEVGYDLQQKKILPREYRWTLSK